jgi:hypothetical protein
MALKTTAEQLEEVQAAISRCLEAQSAGQADKTITRAQLDKLHAREEVLLARYKAETTGAGIPHVNVAYPKRSA